MCRIVAQRVHAGEPVYITPRRPTKRQSLALATKAVRRSFPATATYPRTTDASCLQFAIAGPLPEPVDTKQPLRPPNGPFAAMKAIQAGRADLLRILLDGGVSPDSSDEKKRSMLYHSVMLDDYECAKVLLPLLLRARGKF